MSSVTKAYNLPAMLDIIDQANASGRALQVNKDNSIQFASLGTRIIRSLTGIGKSKEWHFQRQAQLLEKVKVALEHSVLAGDKPGDSKYGGIYSSVSKINRQTGNSFIATENYRRVLTNFDALESISNLHNSSSNPIHTGSDDNRNAKSNSRATYVPTKGFYNPGVRCFMNASLKFLMASKGPELREHLRNLHNDVDFIVEPNRLRALNALEKIIDKSIDGKTGVLRNELDEFVDAIGHIHPASEIDFKNQQFVGDFISSLDVIFGIGGFSSESFSINSNTFSSAGTITRSQPTTALQAYVLPENRNSSFRDLLLAAIAPETIDNGGETIIKTNEIVADLSELKHIKLSLEVFGTGVRQRMDNLHFNDVFEIPIRDSSNRLHNVSFRPAQFICHNGNSPSFGHYYAFLRDKNGDWVEHNDSIVTQMKGSIIDRTHQPVVVYFEKIGQREING